MLEDVSCAICEHIYLLTLHLTLKSRTPSDWLCSNTTSVHLLNSLQWFPKTSHHFCRPPPILPNCLQSPTISVSPITTAAPLQLLTTWGTFLRT